MFFGSDVKVDCLGLAWSEIYAPCTVLRLKTDIVVVFLRVTVIISFGRAWTLQIANLLNSLSILQKLMLEDRSHSNINLDPFIDWLIICVTLVESFVTVACRGKVRQHVTGCVLLLRLQVLIILVVHLLVLLGVQASVAPSLSTRHQSKIIIL